MEYGGYKLVVVKPTVHTVMRSFKERWLSWPWRPWVKSRTYVTPALCEPDKCYLDQVRNIAYCGEQFYRELVEETKKRELKNFSIGGDYAPRP